MRGRSRVSGLEAPPSAFSSQSQGTSEGGSSGVSLLPSVSLALEAIQKAATWAETARGWKAVSSADVEAYGEALSALTEACTSASVRDAALRWEGPPKGPSQEEGGPRMPPLLRHFFRVFCSLCSLCLSEVGVDFNSPPCPLGDLADGSQEASRGCGGPSAEDWLRHGQSLLAALGGSSPIAVSTRQLVLLLYPLMSCLCGSHAAAGAAALLQTSEGAQSLSFLAAVAAAAAGEVARTLPGGETAAPSGESTASPNTTTTSSSSSSSSSTGSSLLLPLVGAYEGSLALQGVAAAARSGPLRGLHRAVQRGAARLLGKAASLPDPATTVLAWLIYHRLSSNSSSNNSGSDGSFSATNVRHLLALLIASIRHHLRRPLEQRVSALCLREALKEQRMQVALAGPTHDAALAFIAVCLQSIQAVAAAAETAEKEAHLQSQGDAAAAAEARMQHLAAAAPISEMLGLICASSPAVRASVAARLESLPPPTQPADGSTCCSSTPADQQQQQQQQQHSPQLSPGRGRSSSALSAASLPALFYIAANGDDLGCTYTSAFLELCVSDQGTRGLGRHLSLQQREDAIAALAANTELKSAAAGACAGSRKEDGLGLRGAASLSLLAALWDGTETLGPVVESMCLLPLSAEGEEAIKRGDTALLLHVLHVSLDLTACTSRHLPRTLRLLQRAAAALAAGPLGSPQTAAEAEKALLLIHKCCALSLQTPWGHLPPVTQLWTGVADVSAAAAGTARGGAADVPIRGEERRCPLVARLEGLVRSTRASMEGSWLFSCRPLAIAMAEESRRRRGEMRGLQQSKEDATTNAAQVAQRLVVTKEAHEMELNRLREAAERQENVHKAEEQRLANEARKLQKELEAEQKRGRDLVSEFQRLLDAKEAAIASLQSSVGDSRNVQKVDVSEVSRDLQIQTAINVKQKEELTKQEAKLNSLLEKQQQTAKSLALLNGKYMQLQDERAKLQLANEKVQEENEQQFRQLILVMKALAEQQAENERLKEERKHSSANYDESKELRVQQLEQQLQQMSRDQERNASAASLQLVALEEKLRAFQEENESLKLQNRRNESAIEDLERRLRDAAEAVVGANAATAAKSKLISQMEKELKEKESRLAVISAALRGT